MCLIVYLASREPIAERRTDAIVVTPLIEEDEPVRRWLSLPHVRSVATAQGRCGCGFRHSVVQDPPDVGFAELFALEDEEDARANTRQFEALVDLIRALSAASPLVELYSCWAEEQSLAPVCTVETGVGDWRGDGSFLRERWLYRISGSMNIIH